MKKPLQYLKSVYIIVSLLLNSFFSFSQPPADYTFTTHSLVSGINNTVGAVYRFTSVKPGVDALVTITGAVNATLATLDQTGVGYNNALQPNITVPSMQTGYIDFRIDFVVAGTSTPSVQGEVPITALDIDGYNFSANQRLYEFEEFNLGPMANAELDFTGSDINVTFSSNTIRGVNVGGVDYGSINLSPNVRFTAFKSGITSLTVRSGANNQDVFNNVTRQRSFYFARFSYPNSMVLAANGLKSFKGNPVQKQFAQLSWDFEKEHGIEKMDVERSTGTMESFAGIHSVSRPSPGSAVFTDYEAPPGVNYYRIKLYEAGEKWHYSAIIKVQTALPAQNNMSLFPNICTKGTTLVIRSQQKCPATVRVADYNGKIYLTRSIQLNEGTNAIELTLDRSMLPGNYVVSVITGNDHLSGKLVKVAR
jgi:hypothetical protein